MIQTKMFFKKRRRKMYKATELKNGNQLIDTHKMEWHIERVRQWQKNPLKVYPIYMEISPIRKCNHRCVFCGLDFLNYENIFLNTQVLIKCLEEMAEKKVLSIMYAGEGEPLLHKDIAKIINATKQFGIDVSLTTNVVPLTKKIVDECLSSITWIKASIDGGTKETHAKIHRCSESHFDMAIKNLAYAVQMRNQLGLTCSIGAQLLLGESNRHEVKILAQILRDIGADYFVVKPYSQHLASINKEQDFLGELDYEECMNMAYELSSMETADFTISFRANTMQNCINKNRSYDKCLATPCFWAYIDSEGGVWTCSAYLGTDEKFLIGNINQQAFSQIWESEKRQKNIEFVKNGLCIKNCRLNCRMNAVNEWLHKIETGEIDINDVSPGKAPYNVNFI